MRSAFSEYHPAVTFAYFAAVILFSVFLMHPLCLAASLAASFACAICLRGAYGMRFGVLYLLPAILLVMIINPAFNHKGTTTIAYLPSGNPLTLESVIYGAAAACLMAAVILWFYCFTSVMTSDKFMYLFGRIIPSLSLVLSMTIRFVPLFAARLRTVRDAQHCVGNSISDTSLVQKFKAAAKVLSAAVSWSMENAIDTADSMKGRGYGSGKRTAYSVFRFTHRDVVCLTVVLILTAYTAVGIFLGRADFSYFPSVSSLSAEPYAVSIFCAYSALCFLPVILHVKEEIRWKYCLSRM